MSEVLFIVMTCFSFAFLCASVGVALWASRQRKKKARESEERSRYNFLLSPFQIFAGGFFIATFLAFFPIWFGRELIGEVGVGRCIRALALSFYSSLQMIFLNADFTVAEGATFSSVVFENIYFCYLSILFAIGPALATGFILSFFKEVSGEIRYRLFENNKDIYLFSELNERSLALAQDVFNKQADNKRKCVLVFTDVYRKNEEENSELLYRASLLNAICTKRDVTNFWLKRNKNIYRKIYLIGKDRDENIQQALELIGICRNNAGYNSNKTQIYIFSTSVECEALLNSVDSGELKVRRVNENANFALKMATECDIFPVNPNAEKIKEINVLIIGMGQCGTELVKALCWISQLPGYKLTIHIFDKEKGVEKKFKSIAPELVKYSGLYGENEPEYTLVFHDSVDVTEYDFQEKIKQLTGITTAFVTLGEDELNIETAIMLRREFGRKQKTDGSAIPAIYAVVYSNAKTKAGKNGLVNMKEQGYGIKFIGSLNSVFSLDNIEQIEWEKKGRVCHMRWAGKSKEDREKEEKKFDKYEYFRNSSIAEACYYELRDKLIGKTYDREILKEYEHKRWMAYMRSDGYIADGEKNAKDDIAKTHWDLIHYDLLDESEKKKDGLE